MERLKRLFDNNKQWAQKMVERDAQFFKKHAEGQTPPFLWIGCADSRVPANEVTGLRPGELFVHRNIANLVVHTDLNCLSVLQYAVEVLQVKDIIVCGHYGCGGVKAASESIRLGVIDNWLRHIGDVQEKHEQELKGINDKESRLRRLCELNVLEQARNVCQTTSVENAWNKGQTLGVHAVIYGLEDGTLKALHSFDGKG